MYEKSLARFGCKIYANAAACALAFGAMSAYGGDSAVEKTGLAPLPLQTEVAPSVAELEKTFWLCDYAAATQGVDATPLDLCAAAYEELKTKRFGGDFEQLLGWWRQNKPAEHRRLSSSER